MSKKNDSLQQMTLALQTDRNTTELNFNGAEVALFGLYQRPDLNLRSDYEQQYSKDAARKGASPLTIGDVTVDLGKENAEFKKINPDTANSRFLLGELDQTLSRFGVNASWRDAYMALHCQQAFNIFPAPAWEGPGAGLVSKGHKAIEIDANQHTGRMTFMAHSFVKPNESNVAEIERLEAKLVQISADYRFTPSADRKTVQIIPTRVKIRSNQALPNASAALFDMFLRVSQVGKRSDGTTDLLDQLNMVSTQAKDPGWLEEWSPAEQKYQQWQELFAQYQKKLVRYVSKQGRPDEKGLWQATEQLLKSDNRSELHWIALLSLSHGSHSLLQVPLSVAKSDSIAQASQKFFSQASDNNLLGFYASLIEKASVEKDTSLLLWAFNQYSEAKVYAPSPPAPTSAIQQAEQLSAFFSPMGLDGRQWPQSQWLALMALKSDSPQNSLQELLWATLAQGEKGEAQRQRLQNFLQDMSLVGHATSDYRIPIQSEGVKPGAVQEILLRGLLPETLQVWETWRSLAAASAQGNWAAFDVFSEQVSALQSRVKDSDVLQFLSQLGLKALRDRPSEVPGILKTDPSIELVRQIQSGVPPIQARQQTIQALGNTVSFALQNNRWGVFLDPATVRFMEAHSAFIDQKWLALSQNLSKMAQLLHKNPEELSLFLTDSPAGRVLQNFIQQNPQAPLAQAMDNRAFLKFVQQLRPPQSLEESAKEFLQNAEDSGDLLGLRQMQHSLQQLKLGDSASFSAMGRLVSELPESGLERALSQSTTSSVLKAMLASKDLRAAQGFLKLLERQDLSTVNDKNGQALLKLAHHLMTYGYLYDVQVGQQAFQWAKTLEKNGFKPDWDNTVVPDWINTLKPLPLEQTRENVRWLSQDFYRNTRRVAAVELLQRISQRTGHELQGMDNLIHKVKNFSDQAKRTQKLFLPFLKYFAPKRYAWMKAYQQVRKAQADVLLNSMKQTPPPFEQASWITNLKEFSKKLEANLEKIQQKIEPQTRSMGTKEALKHDPFETIPLSETKAPEMK